MTTSEIKSFLIGMHQSSPSHSEGKYKVLPPTPYTKRLTNLFKVFEKKYCNTLWKKLAAGAITVLTGIVVIPLLACFASLFTGKEIRVNSAEAIEKFKKDIEVARLNKLKEAVEVPMLAQLDSFQKFLDTHRENASKNLAASIRERLGTKEERTNKRVSETDIDYYAMDVVNLAKDIKNSPKNGIKAEEFQHRVAKLMESPCYQQFKREHQIDIDFLQLCALNLMNADGSKACEKYGEAIFGDLLPKKEEFTFAEAMDVLDKGLSAGVYDRDGGWDTIIWAVNNYDEFVQTTTAHAGKEFNSYKDNAPFRLGMPLTVGDKKIQNLFGPGPTGPISVYNDGVLHAYRKLGLKEIRNSHQSPHKRDELDRIKVTHEWQKENEDVFGHSIFSFDTFTETPEGKKIINDYSEKKNLPTLLEKYENYIKDNCRALNANKKNAKAVTIPLHLLSLEQLDTALKKAHDVINIISEDNPNWNKKDAVVIVQRIYDNVLMRAILEANLPDNFASPCKQHFERGMANTLITYAIDKIIHTGEPKLTRKELFQLLGVVRARAHAGENRSPQQKRIVQAQKVIRALSPKAGAVRTILTGLAAPVA